MSARLIFISILSALLAGCQAAPPPGRAGLRLYVSAEPKTGIRPPAPHVSVYDTAPAGSYATEYSGGGEYEIVDYTTLPDIVVWLEPLDPSASAPPMVPDAVVDVDPGKSAQGVMAAVCVGQKIVFRNSGEKPADVYSVSDGNEFSLGKIAPGASADYTVQKSGLIEVLTSELQDPIAKVYAAPTPWFRLTCAGSTVEMNDLPAGRYRIVSWHPRLPGQQTTADLQPDRIVTVSIKVSVNGLPMVGQP